MYRWLAACAASLIVAGCGGGGSSSRLTVFAAASLTGPLTACGGDGVRFSFAGSDELAAQIRQGVRPDVLAAANTQVPEALAAEGLLEAPRPFASSELVLAVPEGSRVRGLADLGRDGVKLVVGAPSVPVGAYARHVLGGLPQDERAAILANVRSEEPDVKGVVGKLAQGAADAGFVYRTDVRASGGRLRAISLPARLRPRVAYGAGVVAGAGDPDAAAAFVESLVSGACAAALRGAGFGPPPESP